MVKKLVKFKATKIVKKPVIVSFKTKAGKKVNFKAIKPIKKNVIVKFKASVKK